MNKRPKYFSYAVRGNLIVLVYYLIKYDDHFNDFLAVSEEFDFKQTGSK